MRLRYESGYLFTLRVPIFYNGKTSTVVVHAFEGGCQAPNHTRIDVEVRMNGKVIFPRGATWCGIPGNHSVDGIHAKELVLSLIAMKPGDTDPDYFKDYTEDQLEFVERYGEELNMARLDRYCDPETGEPRMPKRRR